ncbi:hypothetical protein PVAP13_9KG562630 [Panicum virgatum]|uniref:Uncharacterized protein n=1 Tax=Panicum virgatum TaxID=38727 RepID=A0A8T0NA62_PANVG|nr:hypothetical protein PVAP13_9NG778877 [Panicum virgatum]KAG2555208.1 hypothetical protein PVAP13_9KG562630 [Panicum virgatum]
MAYFWAFKSGRLGRYPLCAVRRSINSKRGKEPKAGTDGLIKRKSGPQAMHQQPQVGGLESSRDPALALAM